MYKILMFAHDPGGINAITPLIEPLIEEGFQVNPYFKVLPENIVEKFKPSLIITGTSANDKTEKNLWIEAKKNNIKTMAILDHWINYGIRFSKYGLLDIEKFKKNPDIFPNYIIVPDDYAKEEMIKDGVDGKIIYPLGNPHFERIRANTPICSEKLHDTILFASEPYIEDYGFGSEKTAARDIYDFCKENNLNLIIKLHPKEELSKYTEFKDKNVTILKDAPLSELMQKCTLTISMTSMVLIEGAILNLPILSYQPNAITPEKFILTKRKILPFINKKVDLCKHLTCIILNKKPLQYNFNIDFNAGKNIVNFIKEELWQN